MKNHKFPKPLKYILKTQTFYCHTTVWKPIYSQIWEAEIVVKNYSHLILNESAKRQVI